MSQTFSYARLTCMTVGAALALMQYWCGMCMLAALACCGRCICAACAWVQHLHGCSMCMVAAYAWVQHVHGGGICMSAALALVQQMHVCGIVMLVPCWPPPTGRHNAHVHVTTLACSHQGEAPSLRSVPRLSPAYKAGMG